MKRNKKGDLSLSINAIVVLILAITMLGLGLGFMTKIFGGATDDLKEATGTVKKQMIEQLKNSGREVDINRPTLEIKQGAKETLYIALRNDESDTDYKTYNMDLSCKSLMQPDLDMDCAVEGQALFVNFLRVYNVQKGQVGVYPIKVSAPANAEAGTYVVDFSFTKEGANIGVITLTVDITA